MKNNFFHIIIFTVVLFNFTYIVAQESDSLAVINTKYDSLLKSSENEMNVLFYKHKKDLLLNNLGPFGSPFYYPSAFHLKKKSLISQESKLKARLNQIKGFKPYTNITYINASRKEQQFSINHYQEISTNVFFDFNFRKLSSPGAFVNQEANKTIFNGNIKINSKKENYRLNLFANVDRKFYQENGGLTDIDNYEKSMFDDDQNYQVNLINSNAFDKNYMYGFEQQLDLFKIKKDSNTFSKAYLKNRTSYSTRQHVFYDDDPLSKIYNSLFTDSVSYIDSIYFENISNTFSIGYRKDNNFIELFGQYDLEKYEQNFGIDADYHNSYLGLYGNYRFKKIDVKGMTKYGISGYRKSDVESDLNFRIENKLYKFGSSIRYFLREPDLKFISYTSNHFKWSNTSFQKESNLSFNGSVEIKKLKLEIEFETKLLNNLLYYDSLAQANQNDKGINITSFSLSKKYKLLNFYFKSAIIYQITSDEYILPLPELVGRQIIYYQKQIFKKALKFQVGLGVSYSTGFYGYAYMPAINEFYTQRNTKIGEYPKLDVFINTHLKRAQIFLKYEHINAGSNLERAYSVPGYPILNKSLKFGVSWNMFD